jgi:hypothetical protein
LKRQAYRQTMAALARSKREAITARIDEVTARDVASLVDIDHARRIGWIEGVIGLRTRDFMGARDRSGVIAEYLMAWSAGRRARRRTRILMLSPSVVPIGRRN